MNNWTIAWRLLSCLPIAVPFYFGCDLASAVMVALLAMRVEAFIAMRDIDREIESEATL